MNKRLEKVLGDVLNGSEELIFQNEEEFKAFRKNAKAASKKYADSRGYTSTYDGLKLETPVIYPAAYRMSVKTQDDGWRTQWSIAGNAQFDLVDVERFLKGINKNTAKSFIQNLGPDYRF